MLDEKRLTEEKIKKEIERRENIKKTFKVVVGREKEKWEKNAVRRVLGFYIALSSNNVSRLALGPHESYKKSSD